MSRRGVGKGRKKKGKERERIQKKAAKSILVLSNLNIAILYNLSGFALLGFIGYDIAGLALFLKEC
jgi:hypothetical protein